MRESLEIKEKIFNKQSYQFNIKKCGMWVIVNNPSWKQGINIRSSNNQNFVQIPFSNLLKK